MSAGTWLEMADDRDAMRALNAPLEGRVPCMYLDVRGLVTVGVGNLVDPVPLALTLPFRRPDGSLATRNEIANAWRKVKSQGQRNRLWTAYALGLTDLRLDDSAIDSLCDARLLQNEEWIVEHHIPFEVWKEVPADAQLCAMSIAWACGADFPRSWPKFWAAFLAFNWVDAYKHCTIREDNNPGIIPRNEANRRMLSNAQVVTENGMDRDALHWPKQVGKPLATEPAQAPAELIPLELPPGWADDLRTAVNLHYEDL